MLYFAYGMNTNNDQMSKTAQRLGPAVLPGYAWEMLMYANIYEKENASCIGILWEIDELVLAGLDRREGFPIFYTRLEVPVFYKDQTVMAWVYTMTPENRKSLQGTVPSKHYLDSVKEGFATDGLSVANLAEHNNFI
jgi:gamma-glutamylcyclotransferase (GGCT)/AIG2-like uncharacterized protein YtfP